MTIDLKGKQREAFRDALLSAFPSASNLAQMVTYELEENLAAIAGNGPLNSVAYELVEWARAQGKLDRLLRGALEQNSGNRDLKRFAYEVTLTSDALPEEQLEALVVKDLAFPNAAEWRLKMEHAERCVARIEYTSAKGWSGVGTGFLVGPDLLLTNRHVMRDLQPLARPWRANFDYAVDEQGREQGGRGSTFTPESVVRDSDIEQLDYALLRLADPVGKDDAGGRERDWLRPAARAFAPNEPLLILQHPNAQRLKLGVGVITRTSNPPPRVLYTANTLPGSSGSPCFDLSWNLVALHHAGTTAANQGIPLADVVADLAGHVTLGA